jgi:hypothetical protein
MMPADMQPFMEPLAEEGLLSTLRDADRVGFCSESCLRRMAKAVVTRACAPKVLVHPGSMAAVGGTRCCPGGCGGERVLFGNSKVDAVVLGVDGLHKVKHVPLRCQRGVCPLRGKRVWHNFVADDKKHLWNFPERPLPEIVMLTSKFGVTRAWHRQFTLRVLKQHTSFWGEAEVHHPSMGVGAPSKGRLKKLLTKSWFLCRWLERVWERNEDATGLRISDSLEEIIPARWTSYLEDRRRRRASLARECQVTLSKQGLDGHSKTTRRVCCVKKCMKWTNKALGMFALVDCPRTPMHKSPLCQKHKDVLASEGTGHKVRRLRWKAPLGTTLDDVVDIWVGATAADERKVQASAVDPSAVLHFVVEQSLAEHTAKHSAQEGGDRDAAADGEDAAGHQPTLFPDADDWTLAELAAVDCTTHKMFLPGKAHARMKKSRRKNLRSGGFLVSVTPEGFVTDILEFLGSESCTQRYMFLARLKALYPELVLLFHDDACHLRRFASKFSERSEAARAISYPALLFALDRFHARGHVDKWCLENVHPGIDELSAALEGVNTSRNEILFQWLARYKHSFRKMGQWTGNFYAQEVIDLHNEENFRSAGSAAAGSPSSSGAVPTSSSASTSSASSTSSSSRSSS